MKKVLVTGAGGFIGSNLVEELLKRNVEVKAFVHYNSRNDYGNLKFIAEPIYSNIEIISGNIEDPFSVKKAVKGADTVFHLAALIAIPYSYLAPESYIATNIRGTLNILEASQAESVKKIIHTSTSETYGTAIYTPIDENHPLQGQSPYSASKIGADKIVESYYRSFDLPVATIRPFNSYGPRQSARAVIPTIISQVLTTKNQKIKLGSLSPVRDLSFVKDTVEGFIKIAASTKSIGEVINIGFGKGITIGELAQIIINQINPEIGISVEKERMRPEKSEVMKLICDNTKAKNILNWKPSIELEEGIKKTIEFIKQNPTLYKPDIYNI
jgi:NAD dependent epimerase/dehydratase